MVLTPEVKAGAAAGWGEKIVAVEPERLPDDDGLRAQALASDDPEVRKKARLAFGEHRWQIAVPAAKRFCQSLYDRNRPCLGQDCDGPFSRFWALLINECVGTEDKKAVPELVKWWNGKKRLSFEAWVQRIWRQEDALRQWNSVRGLNQRPSPPAGFAERAPAYY